MTLKRNFMETETICEFLKQKGPDGQTNAEKLSNPWNGETVLQKDPSTWSGITYERIGEEDRITDIRWGFYPIHGVLNLSAFRYLEIAFLSNTELSAISIAGLRFLKKLHVDEAKNLLILNTQDSFCEYIFAEYTPRLCQVFIPDGCKAFLDGSPARSRLPKKFTTYKYNRRGRIVEQ